MKINRNYQTPDEEKQALLLEEIPYSQKNGEEILINERPSSRYGLGTIHPIPRQSSSDAEQTDIEADKFEISETKSKDDLVNTHETYLSDSANKKITDRINIGDNEGDDIGLEVASSHKTNINAIGITLSIDSSKGERLLLTPKDGSKSAVYLHREININYLTNDNRSAETRDDWYFRIPVDYQIEIPVNSLEEEFPHPFLEWSVVIYGSQSFFQSLSERY